MSTIPMAAVAATLKQYYDNADETTKIIMKAALTAAGADAVGGAIPGLAIPATIISCFGAVWVMYGAICRKLGISMKDKALKLLARAALANIAANLGGAIAALIAGMLVPGGSVVASAVVSFLTVYLAGLVFLKTLAKMAAASSDPNTFSDMSEGDMKRAMKEAKVTKEDLESARKAYGTSD